MSKLYNDWYPETKSLLETLTKAGFTLLGGDNGEDKFKFKGEDKLDEFIQHLTACDESHLFIGDSTGKRVSWIYLVYGNSPGELPSDYGIPTDAVLSERLDAAIESHYETWETKGQPKITEEQYKARIAASAKPSPTAT